MKIAFNGWAYLAMLLTLVTPLRAQTPAFTGPILGFAWDQRTESLRPFFGTPGAATSGAPIDLGQEASVAAISPRNDFLVTIAAADGQVSLVTLPTLSRRLTGCSPAPDRVVLSPQGRTVACYHSDTGTLEVVSGLPDAPAASFTLTLPLARTLSVSDDAALVAIATGDSVVLTAADGTSSTLPITAAALAFLPGSQDLLVADSGANQLVLVSGGVPQTLAGRGDGVAAPVAVAVSDDGARAFVANAAGGIVTVGIAGGECAVVAPGLVVSGFNRLNGNSLFRVTELSSGPVWILDGGSTGPRLFFIPAIQVEGSGK
jgi:DNA-binding beta-propeller fold protein YncE